MLFTAATRTSTNVRLIQATVPPEIFPDVKRVLDERGIDYFATHETGTDEYEAVLYVSIPEEEVESVLEALYETGLGSDDHVVLINTEVDIFGHADGATAGDGGHARIASAELEGKTADLIPDLRTFVTMMILSTIVATTGVLLDSSAVVVGSMVLAPLFGPAVSTSVGTVIDESDLFWDGVRFQALGVVLAIASASVFAWVMKTTYLLPSGFALTAAPQIVERLSPDLLSLVVALVAGMAGVISIATAAGRALVGVMMAAALLPPAAIVGIGIAWWEPAVAIQSSVLLAVNILAINFAGLVTLWYLGYRPQSWIQVPQTRRALLKRGGTLFVAILVVSAFLFNVTYADAKRSQLEDAIEEDVSTLIDAESYGNVSLVDVKVEQDRTSLNNRTEKVMITLGRPPSEQHSELHQKIRTTVQQRVGHNLTVEIHVTLVIDG
ncbi:TIGR00341 family protein [Halobacteriales archaeon SW_6_65_15]|nr:MAG: TIGR00341 family protein [Halobacteriales archaeon SW_6_65_15]